MPILLAGNILKYGGNVGISLITSVLFSIIASANQQGILLSTYYYKADSELNVGKLRQRNAGPRFKRL